MRPPPRSPAQVWQWRHHRVALDALDTRETVTPELMERLLEEEFSRLDTTAHGRLPEAAHLVRRLVLAVEFTEFLMLPGYRHLA